MKLLLSLFTVCVFTISYAQDFTEVLKGVAFNRGEEDRMGFSVAIDGNYAVVGSYAHDEDGSDPNTGAAYIYEKTGIDNWQFVQRIINSDQDNYDRFGYSVAIDGEMIVVGAYGEDHDMDDDNSLSSAGSAYLFKRGIDGVWTEMQKIIASDRDEDDEFGWSVDISDSTVIVGAHHEGHDLAGLNFMYHAGAAYIFDLDELGVWNETQKIVASQRSVDRYYPAGRDDDYEDISDLFGGAVALDGDYIIVGAHNHDYDTGGYRSGTQWNAGAAYIFERSAGVWSETQKLLNHDRYAWDRFGYAVDIDSSTIVVGVWSEDESEFDGAELKNAGSAYIFTRDIGGVWNEVQKLDASDRTTGDHFGIDVGIDGDYIVFGAEQEDLDADGSDDLSNAGAAYIFQRDEDGVWAEINKIVQSDRAVEDRFGEGVAISGHTVLVGAWQQDYDADGGAYLEDAGAAYFFSSIVCETEFVYQDITICRNDSIVVGQSIYFDGGIYIDSLYNMDACDSVITTNLTVIEPVLITQDITICSGISYNIGANEYTETGVFIDTLVAILTGCDSIVTTNLTVTPPINFTQDITICSGTTYTIGENTYDESGAYIDWFVTEEGCDSSVTTYLSIDPPINNIQTLTICAGNSVEVGVSIYTETGEYIDHFVTETGCDSMVTTRLTVNPPIEYTNEIAICFGETYAIGESIYDASGSYFDDFITETGCDSIVNTMLTVYPYNTSEQSFTICSGNEITVGESVYTETGVYTDVFTSIEGCDSTVTTNLTVNDPLTYSQEITLCYGESLFVGDIEHNEAGLYIDELVTETGCDSIVTTNLIIRDENVYEQTINLCGGETYTIGAATYTESGTYMDTLISIETGCDSIVTTNLDILDPIDMTITREDALTLVSNEPESESTFFRWITCDPLQPIDGEESRTFIATENGEYAVVIEKDFCIDTSACFLINSVGINEINPLSQIKCYPNPTNGNVTIARNDDSSGPLNVVVLNNLGAVIYQNQMTAPTLEFDLSEYASGIYFVRIAFNSDVWVEKLIRR
ncbi:T9SS type A sorting domain-containing protein [Crocinitomix catalasitica]|uniref:T9SS type A sorting domain-containing protein n=1 Tax=Crocinitomix catalasitica TaxID=184607 RepID=UPI0012F7CE44|nr:T9SS type A sorting domain-containing protein [Crocinitomix catalasitica]